MCHLLMHGLFQRKTARAYRYCKLIRGGGGGMQISPEKFLCVESSSCKKVVFSQIVKKVLFVNFTIGIFFKNIIKLLSLSALTTNGRSLSLRIVHM